MLEIERPRKKAALKSGSSAVFGLPCNAKSHVSARFIICYLTFPWHLLSTHREICPSLDDLLIICYLYHWFSNLKTLENKLIENRPEDFAKYLR